MAIPHLTGRLAPSPTGALHLGNARSFLLAWLSIRQRGGRLILRIEDIDSPRVKPWARQATLDDLAWLNLDWDEGPDIGGPHAPYVQTERLARYQWALEFLKQSELVYPCDCSRSEIAAAASAPHEAMDGPIYPGRCRQRSVRSATDMDPQSFAWRFRASHQRRSWLDAIAGEQSAVVATAVGDFIVAKGDGTPAYQLAVVVDDYEMGVSEVVRGQDLIPSTFRQLDLLDALGWPVPSYMHVPLMIGADGRRLAKRHGDTRVAWFREAGYSPEQLWGFLAWTAGLLDEPRLTLPRELLPTWSPLKVIREPSVVELNSILRVLDSLHS